MCGIAGRFHPLELPSEVTWHARADALLSHRGPDGRGHYADACCELVHRRLALIDLTPTGSQPMTNEEESVFVVFNGEIYNHPELRAELTARGHVFRGTSDTEVLVHLYEDRGERMVDRLRGIFAFAVYDRARRTLLLARDRFGVKPLFYAEHEGQWVFASEIKAILALRGFEPGIDRQACYDFLGLGYIPEPATGFARVHALPAATAITIGAAGARETRFHQISARPDPTRRLEEAVDATSTSLLDAVKRQSVADVPVAALLSGGIDSSLVVAAHHRATGGPTTTFNVRFPDKRLDETDVALAVARHYGTEHHTIDLSDWAVTPDAILGLLRHFDQPFADTSLVPTFWISRAVRERGIICTLSGDGGDEGFGGYARFWRANTLVRLMRLPPWMRATVGRAGSALAAQTRDWGRQVSKAVELASVGRENSSVLMAGLSNYLSERQKEEFVTGPAREQLEPVYRHFDGYCPAGVAGLEELSQRLTEKLFAVSLPSDMLRKVDMMSMLASIEVRVPMLDEDLVDIGLTLPHRLKTDGKAGKRVLRGLARRWLPAEVAAHPKHGFSIPLDVMLPDTFHDAAADHLLGAGARVRPILDITLLERWLEAFRQARDGQHGGAISRGGTTQRVFLALALELWLREHNLSW
jgi:asparagine synthase (glutamine-hydrolysing)